jgi:hypothetical protein
MSEELAIQQIPNSTEVSFTNKDVFDQMARAAAMMAKTDIVPQTYRGKPENCFVAIEMASRMGVSPLMVMQNLYVVQGKPSWSGQAATAMLKNSPEFRGVKHVYTGERNKDNWGCYVEAERVSSGEIVKGAEVTIDMAKKEGWHGKGGSKWQTMPELMLAYRASAFFARVHCPELLMGMQTKEEVEDVHGKGEKTLIVDVLK